MTQLPTTPTATTERGGKYLTFALDETEYGLEILKVREIIGMMEITVVPRTPDSVRGVMNLRGKIIPVLDLREIFAMSSLEDGDETRIIVVETAGLEIGIVVDNVHEVIDVREDEIEDPPSFGIHVSTNFVLGMGTKHGRVTILLAIDRVLGDEEIAAVQNFERNAPADPQDAIPL